MGARLTKHDRKAAAHELVTSIRTSDDLRVLELLHQLPKVVFERDRGDPSQTHPHHSSRPGHTALYVAAGVGKVELVRLIIETAKREAHAKYFRNPERAKAKVDALLNVQTARGETPLMHACRKGGTLRHARYMRSEAVARYVEVVKVLLQEGADPLMTDTIGRTCLHIAALHSASSCISAVLSADYKGVPLKETVVQGTPFVDMQASRGFTALQMATCSSHRSAAAALLAAGASLHLNNSSSFMLDNETLLEVPWGQMTPLHIAAHRGDAHMAWILLHAQTALPALHRNHGDDVRLLRDAQGHRPVDIARSRDFERLTRLLDPERDLPQILQEMESEVLLDREARNPGGRDRGHRERRRSSRHTALGPPRLSVLCSVRLRHNLLQELKHIAIAATPGSSGRRRHRSSSSQAASKPSEKVAPAVASAVPLALAARLPDNWQEVLAQQLAASRDAAGNGHRVPPCPVKFQDGQLVLAARPPVTSERSRREAQAQRDIIKHALMAVLERCGGDSDGSCPATPIGGPSRSTSGVRRSTTSDAEASPSVSGIDGESSGPRVSYRCLEQSADGLRDSPFLQLPDWDSSFIGPGAPVPPLYTDSSCRSTSEAGGTLTHISSLQSAFSGSQISAQDLFAALDITEVLQVPGGREGEGDSSVMAAPALEPIGSAELLEVLEPPREPPRDQPQAQARGAASAAAPSASVTFEAVVPQAPDAAPASGSAGGSGKPRSSGSSSRQRCREDTPDDELCPICCEAHPGVAVKVCGHALCGTCARKLCKLKASEPPTCPFCRQIINGFRIAIPVRP
eukprot:jgi/Botrbrau1/1681/Bobra.116_2s0025.1